MISLIHSKAKKVGDVKTNFVKLDQSLLKTLKFRQKIPQIVQTLIEVIANPTRNEHKISQTKHKNKSNNIVKQLNHHL